MKCDIFCEGVKEWIDSRCNGKYFFEYQDYRTFPTDPMIEMLLESPEHKVYIRCFAYKEEIEQNDDPLAIQTLAEALLSEFEEKIYLTLTQDIKMIFVSGYFHLLLWRPNYFVKEKEK